MRNRTMKRAGLNPEIVGFAYRISGKKIRRMAKLLRAERRVREALPTALTNTLVGECRMGIRQYVKAGSWYLRTDPIVQRAWA